MIHFLLISHFILHSKIQQYFELFHYHVLSQSRISSSMDLVFFRSKSSTKIPMKNNTFYDEYFRACSFHDDDNYDIDTDIDNIRNSYYQSLNNRIISNVDDEYDELNIFSINQNSSCIYRVEKDRIHVISDSNGLMPIWYSFSSNRHDHFIAISTDLMILQLEDYIVDAVVTSGYQVIIDIQLHEIDSISRSKIQKKCKDHSIVLYDVNTLSYQSAKKIVSNHIYYKSNPLSLHFPEWLFDYWIDKMDHGLPYPQSIRSIVTSEWNVLQYVQTHNSTLLLSLNQNDNNNLLQGAYEIYFLHFFNQIFQVPIIYSFEEWNQYRLERKNIDINPVLYSLSSSSSSFTDDCNKNEETLNRFQFVGKKEPSPILVFSSQSLSFVERESNMVSSLATLAKTVSDEKGFLFLVLATSGYNKMLQNFLCFTSKFQSGKYILVITPHDDIIILAKHMNIGYYKVNINHSSSSSSPSSLPSSMSSFGSYEYQSLIVQRTKIAYELLQLGFSPIISDIDTVWLQDPLTVMYQNLEVNYENKLDMSVVMDEEEICGCFIVLQNTKNTIAFWYSVKILHEELISQAVKRNYKLDKIFDSEQKILTKLLIGKEYNGTIHVSILSSQLFPSGLQYFTHQKQDKNNYTDNISSLSSSTTFNPVIIHNNFIIGSTMKVNRFRRYHLWSIFNHNFYEDNLCRITPFPDWNRLFYSAVRDISIPTIHLVLPIHGSILSHSPTTLVIQVITENFFLSESSGKIWIQNNPPTFIPFTSMGIFELRISKGSTLSSITVTMDSFPSVSVVVDLQISDHNFDYNMESCGNACDSNTSIHSNVRNAEDFRHQTVKRLQTYEYTLRRKFNTILLNDQRNRFHDNNSNSDHHHDYHHHTVTTASKSSPILSNSTQIIETVSYCVKVLAFNRPSSLLRLLTSLANAYYDNHSVSLEIFIDGPLHPNASYYLDIISIDKVRNISKDFEWKYGEKLITIRDINYGLVKQWYHAWSPTEEEDKDINQVAFIFEDDIEVSKYFFRWTHKRVIKYMISNSNQVTYHKNLLSTIRNFIQNSSNSGSSNNISQCSINPIQDFRDKYLGEPVLYGICLQKQHVDPSHHPRKLEIKNNFQPFLYSLIGSWGPALFSFPWIAFKLWWDHHLFHQYDYVSNQYIDEIFSENLITHYYYQNNPNIWTPWHIKFSHVTGMKCLYSNLPDNYSLIINHREMGENYNITLGSDTRLIDNVEDNKDVNDDNSKMVQSSFDSLPNINILSQQQYDLHIRRIGYFESEFSYEDFNLVYDSTDTLFFFQSTFPNLYNWIRMTKDSILLSKQLYPLVFSLQMISAYHYHSILNMLDRYISHDFSVIHLEISPLTLLLLKNYNYNQSQNENINQKSQTIILSNEVMCNQIKTTFQLSCFLQDEHISSSIFHRNIKKSIAVIPIDIVEINMDIHNKTILCPMTQYLLILGTCASAPTEIKIKYDLNNNLLLRDNKNHDNDQIEETHQNIIKLVTYVMIESMCSENDEVDVGGVLYRKIVDKVTSKPHFIHIIKRLQGGILSTQAVISNKND